MTSFLILLLCSTLAHVAWSADSNHQTPSTIATPSAEPAFTAEALILNTKDRGGFDPAKDPWVETLGWAPRSYIYHNMITEEECQHIIRQSAPQLKRSTVVGANGASVEDPVRTSYGTFIRRYQDPVIERIQNKVATWTHLPVVNQEDMQVLRYGKGQKYGAHFDSHQDRTGPGPVGRVATVLIYLNDCEEGGETAFPETQWPDPTVEAAKGPFSDCAKGHVAFKPKKGDALLFFSLSPDIIQDSKSMHTGCPVVKGFKWTTTIWIHTDPFRPETFKRPKPEEMPVNPGLCTDNHPSCEAWAKSGECKKNPGFMVGGAFAAGQCRKACNECEGCAADDTACMNRNRERSGYLVYEKEEFDHLGVNISSIPGMGPAS